MENHETLEKKIENIENDFENLKQQFKPIENLRQDIETFIENNSSYKSLRDRVDINSNEINQIQLETTKPKKWWKNTTFLFSLISLLISIIATFYSYFQDKRKDISEQKLRAKEIVRRLSDLQVQYASTGTISSAIQQVTFPEACNLVYEAVEIANLNPEYLTDAEYATIIIIAMNTNLNDRLAELFEKAKKVKTSNPMFYSINNSYAAYYFNIKNEPNKGREIVSSIIENTKMQSGEVDLKRINIATEYCIWSGFEYQIRNYSKADSVLSIAENLIIKCPDFMRFQYSPAVQRINNFRIELNKYLSFNQLSNIQN